MNNNRFGVTAVILMMLFLPLCPAVGDREAGRKKVGADPDKASVWMTKKIEFSQKILQGLTRGDFEMVQKNADAMVVVGYLEKWDREGLPAYKKQLTAFERANKELIRQAQKKDIAAATKAYTQLIVSCVECHTVVRDVKKK